MAREPSASGERMTAILALPLLGAALLTLRSLEIIRWPWWLCTAPVFAVPVAVTLLCWGVAGVVTFVALFVAELVTGRRTPAWFELKSHQDEER